MTSPVTVKTYEIRRGPLPGRDLDEYYLILNSVASADDKGKVRSSYTRKVIVRMAVQIDAGDYKPDEVQWSIDMRLSAMSERIRGVLRRKGQVILYGPPGTGKRYHAKWSKS